MSWKQKLCMFYEAKNLAVHNISLNSQIAYNLCELLKFFVLNLSVLKTKFSLEKIFLKFMLFRYMEKLPSNKMLGKIGKKNVLNILCCFFDLLSFLEVLNGLVE